MAHTPHPSAKHRASPERPYWSRVLRALREARGITQDGWAAQLGYGRATIKRWEAGEAVPSAGAEALLIEACRERGLFRAFEQGPLRGKTVTPESLRDLLVEARLGTSPSQVRQPPASAEPGKGSDPTEAPVLPDDVPAERRQLTVVVCGLADAAALAMELDPEELCEVREAHQAACAAASRRFDGYIAGQFTDRLFIYFGYPLAHEDDARRAVHAALGMLADMKELNARLGRQLGRTLAVRIGIHTGMVVAGEQHGGGQPEAALIVGGTADIAALLQNEAAADTVVISPATHRLVDGYFACRAPGIRLLQGVAEPLPLYQVLHATAARSRLDLAGPGGLTPLVGREQELGLLLERWRHVSTGAGQAVALSGEPGIGKSRLLQALKERLAGAPYVLLECHCSPYHQSSAFYPITEMLKRMAGFGEDGTPTEKLATLEAVLRRYGLSSIDILPLFAALLGVPFTAPNTLPTVLPEQQKRQTLEAVLLLLLRMAAQQPLLFVVEDLHWCDASTLELLDLVIEQLPTTRVLALLTLRPEFTPPWPLRAHLTHLTLGRLPQEQTEALIERVAGRKPLPNVVIRQVALRADGVPLFVEELTRAVLESGVLKEAEDRYELRGLLFSLAIPVTLQDSLRARLDRLGSAREVAQWGASLGREFTYTVLRAVCPLDEVSLQRALGRLVDAELLYPRGVPPHATYLFKHALVQEAAYQSLLRSKRQLYHRQIAQVLTERLPELADTQPELIAHHFTEAGLKEQAIAYWQRAGQRAIERSANAEALVHLTRGLGVLQSLPQAPERLQQELELQTALGLVLMPSKGYGSAEVESVYRRALELCRQIGETPRRFSVLRGLWEFYDLRADTRTARLLAEELLRLADAEGDRGLQVIAHHVLGETLLWPGEFQRALEHTEQAIGLYNPQAHRTLAFLHGGYDAGVVCRTWAAHALWYLGFPDQALQRCREALTLARELAHPHTLTFALSHAAVLHQSRREAQAAREQAEAAIAIATDAGFEFWVAFATILRGWALAEQGEASEGIAQIRRGIAGYRAAGAELEVPLWLALLAQACSMAGQYEEAFAAVAEGLENSNTHGVRFYEAELHRLKGELLLDQPQPDPQQAEACFHAAMNIADQQQAKSLALRAATSLGHLWQKQGKRSEAHQMLSMIYDWFAEGFHTADLTAARDLLEATRTNPSPHGSL